MEVTRTGAPVLCVPPLVLKPSLTGLNSRLSGMWCTVKNLQFPWKPELKLYLWCLDFCRLKSCLFNFINHCFGGASVVVLAVCGNKQVMRQKSCLPRLLLPRALAEGMPESGIPVFVFFVVLLWKSMNDQLRLLSHE